MFNNRRGGKLSFFVLIILVTFTILSSVVLGLFSEALMFKDNNKNSLEKEINEINEDNHNMNVIILTASSGALGFGHTALLFENNDSWFYFSWQSTKVVFLEVPLSALDCFDSFNSWIREEDSLQNYIADFDSAILINGDFEESLNMAENIFLNYLSHQNVNNVDLANFSYLDSLSKNHDYDLFFNNCVKVSHNILSQGNISDRSFSEIVKNPSFISNVANKQFELFLDYEPFFE